MAISQGNVKSSSLPFVLFIVFLSLVLAEHRSVMCHEPKGNMGKRTLKGADFEEEKRSGRRVREF